MISIRLLMSRMTAVAVTAALLAGSCGSGDEGSAEEEEQATTTTTEPPPPLVESPENVYEIDWSALGAPPYFGYDDETDPEDPFWLINNQPEVDGFLLGVELYTTGFGERWEGELGTYRIWCDRRGTGICLHFDPDGEGPVPDLGADFGATGTVSIRKLDRDGYDLVLEDVLFTDGSRIPGPLTLRG